VVVVVCCQFLGSNFLKEKSPKGLPNLAPRILHARNLAFERKFSILMVEQNNDVVQPHTIAVKSL